MSALCVVSRMNLQCKHQLGGITEEQGRCIGNYLETLFRLLRRKIVFIIQARFSAIITWKYSYINTLKICLSSEIPSTIDCCQVSLQLKATGIVWSRYPYLNALAKFLNHMSDVKKIHVDYSNYFIEYHIYVIIPKCYATMKYSTLCEMRGLYTTIAFYQLVVLSVDPSWRGCPTLLCKVCKPQFQ